MRKKLDKDISMIEGIIEWTDYVISDLHRIFGEDKISVVIPAYNEQKRIRKVINAVRKSRADEVIVVDDGSEDRTYDIAKSAGAKVFRHPVNMGKGAAMHTGLKKSRGSIVAFVDGDLESLTPRAVNSLIIPILNDEADFVKSHFNTQKKIHTRSALLYKPLIKHLFNSIGFIHPVSGQIADVGSSLRT